MRVLINQNFRTHNYIIIYIYIFNLFPNFSRDFPIFLSFQQKSGRSNRKTIRSIVKSAKIWYLRSVSVWMRSFQANTACFPWYLMWNTEKSAFHVGFQENSIKYDGNDRISEHFVAEWATHNRHKRNFAAISQNISRPPVFTGLSYSVLSLIQHKNYDIILSES